VVLKPQQKRINKKTDITEKEETKTVNELTPLVKKIDNIFVDFYDIKQKDELAKIISRQDRLSLAEIAQLKTIVKSRAVEETRNDRYKDKRLLKNLREILRMINLTEKQNQMTLPM
jgi:hypothetical protein